MIPDIPIQVNGQEESLRQFVNQIMVDGERVLVYDRYRDRHLIITDWGTVIMARADPGDQCRWTEIVRGRAPLCPATTRMLCRNETAKIFRFSVDHMSGHTDIYRWIMALDWEFTNAGCQPGAADVPAAPTDLSRSRY